MSDMKDLIATLREYVEKYEASRVRIRELEAQLERSQFAEKTFRDALSRGIGSNENV